jgi:hypothetical protein
VNALSRACWWNHFSGSRLQFYLTSFTFKIHQRLLHFAFSNHAFVPFVTFPPFSVCIWKLHVLPLFRAFSWLMDHIRRRDQNVKEKAFLRLRVISD